MKKAYVVRMKETVPEADLVAAWGSPPKEKSGNLEFYAKGTDAYFLPTSDGGKTLVIVPKDVLPDLLKLQGQQPPLMPELDYLALQTTDADRHFTLLYMPQFLESGGRSLVTGMGAKLLPAVDWLYTGAGLPPMPTADNAGEPPAPPTGTAAEKPRAALASAHLGDSFFYELRMHNSGVNAFVEALAEPLQAQRERDSATRGKLCVQLHAFAIQFKVPPQVSRHGHVRRRFRTRRRRRSAIRRPRVYAGRRRAQHHPRRASLPHRVERRRHDRRTNYAGWDGATRRSGGAWRLRQATLQEDEARLR
ncbi:MAG: hypothetical protein QM775_09975 [Pirellulales bacterium]